MSLSKRNVSLFGDISHRDIYQRNRVQVAKQGDIDNYSVHVNAANIAVDTLLERASLDGAGFAKYEVFTKPSTGNLMTSANASMVEVTTGRTAIRSLVFQATGNVAVGGSIGITGSTTLLSLTASGPATLHSASITGQTILGNTNIALGNNGTLSVTGNGNVDVGTNSLSSAGNVFLTGPTTVGPYIGPWVSRQSASDVSWTSVTYGNGLFVAVASTGTGNRVMTSPDGLTWTSRSTSGLDFQWRALTYANGLFVAVGTNTIMTSPDGFTWTRRTNGVTNRQWYSVIYGNGLFVAVAAIESSDSVITSPDGFTWISRTSAIGLWRGVTYGNGLFVAVSFNQTGTVMTSPDGITWTSQSGFHADSVTYGNGLFVAVGNIGGIYTSPDGINWTNRTGTIMRPNGTTWVGSNYWRFVTYGNGLFVAVSSSGLGDRVTTSPNGITWTIRSSAADIFWQSITYGNYQFVAVASSGTGDRVMTANAGLPNLAARTSLSGNLDMRNNEILNVTSMTRDNVRIFMDRNTRSIQAQTWANNAWSTTTTTSQDAFAVNKLLSVSGDSTLLGNLVLVNGMTVGSSTIPRNLTVFGNLDIKGTTTTTSIESNTVQMRELNLELGYLQVNSLLSLHGGGLTLGGPGGILTKRPTLAYNSTLDAWQPNIDIVTTSVGATDLALVNTQSGFVGSRLATNANVFTKMDPRSLNFGDNWRFKMNITGNVDTPWISQTTPADVEWESVAYGNNRFVAVSTTGNVMTTFDGSTWTLGATNLVAARNIVYGKDLFVVVQGGPAGVGSGLIGTIATSRDGTTWTYVNTGPHFRAWEDVAYGNNIFVAVGNDRRFLTSINGGVTWGVSALGADRSLLGVTYGLGVFVAVGSGVTCRGDGVGNFSYPIVNSNLWTSVTYGNGLFVAVASSGTANRVMTSPNGNTWTTRNTTGLDFAWSSVTFANDLFVAVATSGHIMTSYDGITWTARTSASTNSWRRVTYGNGVFVAVAGTGTGNRVMTFPWNDDMVELEHLENGAWNPKFTFTK